MWCRPLARSAVGQRGRARRARWSPPGRRSRGSASGSRGRRAVPAASASSSGSMNRFPRWPVGCPWPSRYGRAHRGGERLAHAVEHQLDRGGAEVAAAVGRLPARLQRVELVQAAVPVPPQRPGDPAGQQPVGGGAPVGVERVGDADLARLADAGVLDAGDAERVQVPLGGEQPGDQLGLARAAERSRRPGASRRRAARRSGCPSWSRSIRPSAGSGVRSVTPAMASAAVFTQALWWSRLGRNAGRPPVTASRSAAVGRAAGEGRHRPAAAEHPGAARQRRAVGGDRVEVLRPGLAGRPGCSAGDSSPPWTGCTCASPNAGIASRPRRSITRVNGPMRSRISVVAAERPDHAAADRGRLRRTRTGGRASGSSR